MRELFDASGDSRASAAETIVERLFESMIKAVIDIINPDWIQR